MLNDQTMRPVDPTATPAGYIGGKRNLAKRVIARIVGMGGIFLRRRLAPKAEVINDYSGDVANFFRILQRHYPQFLDTLRFQVTSRREFERLKACDPATLTDLERAARFLYLQRLAFGGKVAGRSFGVDIGRTARFDLTRVAPMLEDVHERLAGVVIENLPWRTLIERYDRPATLFYLDPPYYGCENDYGAKLFDRSQFEEMAEVLSTLKGRFILSINDVPQIRAVFGRFDMTPVELSYTIAARGPQKAKELIIEG